MQRRPNSPKFGASFTPMSQSPPPAPQSMNMEDFAGRPVPLELQKTIADNPELGNLFTISISEDAKKMLFDLFQTLNTSRSGKLQWTDFEQFSSSIPKWQEIRQTLDFDQDGQIDFKEFVYGISKMAISRAPASMTINTQCSLESWFDLLTELANKEIEKMCQDIWRMLQRR